MFLKMIRLGYANNSSSSHSLIFVSNDKLSSIEEDDSYYEFGWNEFALKSKINKEVYLLRQLTSNIKYEFDNDLYDKTLRYRYHLTDYNFIKDNNLETLFKELNKNNIFDSFRNYYNLIQDCYIDHQSVWRLPINRLNNELNLLFIRQIFDYIINNNNLVIIGGNDNMSDDESEFQEYKSDSLDLYDIIKMLNSMRESNKNNYCYFDKFNNDWVVQTKDNGNIFRFSLDNPNKTQKSTFPHLIDIKITDFCNLGCPFCYQSSTIKGKHANLDAIKSYFNILHNSSVFEIVLGGGEPTQHPQILEILKEANNYNFVVGLTTKNYNLHKHQEFSEIVKCLDTLAISCNDINDLPKVVNLAEQIKLISRDVHIYIQSIWGIIDENLLQTILEEISNHYYIEGFTLLGYKEFGFGENYKSIEKNANWLEKIKTNIQKMDRYKIGIDAVMVKQYYDEIVEAGVNKVFLNGEEGKFSCYLDCVNKTLSPSSYNNETIIPFDIDINNFLEIFSKF